LYFLYYIVQRFKDLFSMGGGNKNKETYLPGRNYSQTVVDMQTTQLVLYKSCLSDLVEFLIGHFLIGRIFYSLHFASIQDIGPYLPQKNIMGTDSGLRLVLSYGIGNESGCYRSLQKYIFYFVFFHGNTLALR